MVVNSIPSTEIDDTTEVESFEGPIHVSFASVKSTIPSGRYKMIVADKKNIVSTQKGTPGIQIYFAYDKDMYPDYEKRRVSQRFWLTPGAYQMLGQFLVQAGINPEMLREEPIPGQFTPDGKQLTKCVYSLPEQIGSVIGAVLWIDVIEEEIDGVALDGITPEKKWINNIANRGFTKYP